MVGGDEEGGEVGPAGGGVEVLQRGGGRSWLVGGLGGWIGGRAYSVCIGHEIEVFGRVGE